MMKDERVTNTREQVRDGEAHSGTHTHTQHISGATHSRRVRVLSLFRLVVFGYHSRSGYHSPLPPPLLSTIRG
jgi:hypothetical protein